MRVLIMVSQPLRACGLPVLRRLPVVIFVAFREAADEVYKNRRGRTLARKDIFVGCPWLADLRRASPAEHRSALLRAKKHLAPANSFGLGDAPGRGNETLSDGASSLLDGR